MLYVEGQGTVVCAMQLKKKKIKGVLYVEGQGTLYVEGHAVCMQLKSQYVRCT